MQSSAMPMNSGLNGSSLVRVEIQAPPTPTLTNNRGPRQQAEAARAASPPPMSVDLASLSCSIGSLKWLDKVTINPVLQYRVKRFCQPICKSL